MAPRGPPWPPVAGFLLNRPFWRPRPAHFSRYNILGGTVGCGPWPPVLPVASRGLPWPLVASGAPWPPMALHIGYAIQDMRNMICDTRYAIHYMQYMICDTLYAIHNLWSIICDTYFAIRYSINDTLYAIHNLRHTIVCTPVWGLTLESYIYIYRVNDTRV